MGLFQDRMDQRSARMDLDNAAWRMRISHSKGSREAAQMQGDAARERLQGLEARKLQETQNDARVRASMRPPEGQPLNLGTPSGGVGQDDLGMPAQSTPINSGGAAAPGGLTNLGVQRTGNTYSASPGVTLEPGSYDPNPNVSYGAPKPSLQAPSSFGLPDLGEMWDAFVPSHADGGPIYGPPGLDQVPAQMPDGSPARLNDGEYVLPKEYVIGLAKKSLGKKGDMLAPEKLHALGVDLLDGEVAQYTGQQPGAKPAPPLPGQEGMVPAMAGGGPIQEYGGYPYVEGLPPRSANALRVLPPRALGNREGELARAAQQAAASRIPPGAQEHAANVARTNNTIGAARAAGASAPEFMRTPPLSNNMPIPYEGPVRFARPPVPMAGSMQPPLAVYSGSPSYDGSASYWRGMGAPPTNQMPVEFANPERSLSAPRQGGAVVPYEPPPAGESFNPRGTAYARADGTVEMGTNSQRGLVPRAGVPARYQPPPVIEGQFTEILPRGSRTSPNGFFMDMGGPERTVDINGTQVTIPNDVFGMRAMAQQPINTNVVGAFGDMVSGLRDRVMSGPLAEGIRTWNDRRKDTPKGRQGPISMGQEFLNKGQPKAVPAAPARIPITSDLATQPRPHTPEGFTPGTPGNTQGYADRVKAQLDADQMARAKAYYASTGLQSAHPDDVAYMEGLRQAFEAGGPNRNYAAQINRGSRRGTTPPAPREIPWQQRALQDTIDAARMSGVTRGLAMKDMLPVFMNAYKPQQPNVDMMRFQYQQGRDKVSDAKWVAEQQAAAEQAIMQQAGNAYRNVIMVDQVDEDTGQVIQVPYFFGPTGLVPLLGGNMGNTGVNRPPIINPRQAQR